MSTNNDSQNFQRPIQTQEENSIDIKTIIIKVLSYWYLFVICGFDSGLYLQPLHYQCLSSFVVHLHQRAEDGYGRCRNDDGYEFQKLR